MAELSKLVRWEIAIHVLVWTVILLLPCILSSAGEHYMIGGIPGSFFTMAGFIHMAIFYFNAFFLYPKLAHNWRWWLYIPASIVLIVVSFMIKYQIVASQFPEVLRSGSAQFVFAPSVFVFIASVIYRRVADSIQKEKQKKEQHAQRLAAELKFLRSQINPHFLFNVLTNMVSLARSKSEHLEPALLRLSDLMRYMLYETKGEKVPVSKELKYLGSYIELQKLRFGDTVDIIFKTEVDDTAAGHEIEPLLLVPFVENAFKHGVGLIENPYIYIRLQIRNGALQFEVNNNYDEQGMAQKDDSSGIGLENVRTRLALLYPQKHELRIDESDSTFHVTLNLTLI